jgi:hypothetical protein
MATSLTMFLYGVAMLLSADGLGMKTFVHVWPATGALVDGFSG